MRVKSTPSTWPHARKLRVARQFEQGVTLSALATQHGVSRRTIMKLLDELGVTINSRQTIRGTQAFPSALTTRGRS